eukprot:XP_001200455.2 PREDICTED: uncharacterized protein LOC764215 isoform X1 [Strongylocentrotus purpuratus]
MSEIVSWTKRYTFRVIHFSKFFKTEITITPKTNETRFCISCLNVNGTLSKLSGESFYVIKKNCETVEILSTAEITVYGMVFSSIGFTAGFLAIPHGGLGTEYLIDCYTPVNRSAQVAIAAISDNTITIDCANNCTFNNTGVSGPIKLRAGQSGILTNVERETEMTGTYIRSDKPISVIVGASNVYIPRDSLDLGEVQGVILEQLLPISSWGIDHIVPPFQQTPNGWILRILAINASTNISMTDCGGQATASLSLDSKEYMDIPVNGTSQNLCLIQANQPIQVMQYVASSPINEQYGDPSMTIIPAVTNYHGNTTVRVNKTKENMRYFGDVVVLGEETPMLQLNGSEMNGTCYPNSSRPMEEPKSALRNKRFCHYSTELQNGVYHVTHGNQSARFWVRLYTLHDTLGVAMLADIGVRASLPIEETTDTKTSVDELKWKRADFEDRFPGNFSSYEQAEEALGNVTSCLMDRELGSVNEVDIVLGFFKGVLTRRPLMNATVDEAGSFLNGTADVLNVLFSNKTTEHLTRACVEGRNLTSSPEDVQYELENLLTSASELIVDGGISSFGVSRENTAFTIKSTNGASSSDVSTTLAECEDALYLAGNDVRIPCEVVQEMGSRAVYQIMLPYGGDILASSKCGQNRTKIGSPLLSVGLVSNQTEQPFSKNISFSFVTRSLEVDAQKNNTLCSYWDYEESDWSTSGCTLGSIDVTNGEAKVTCLCNHLTSFAVLIDVSPGEIDERNQEIMMLLTWIGCSFSIAACFLTIFGYAFLRLRSDLILVHGNLALSVGLAETAFLCLSAVPNPAEQPISCIILASVIYYHFIAMFAWMAIEGVHLYLLTFVVWNAEKRKIKMYMACGWGIPIIFVAMLLVVNFTRGIVFKNYCFLSMEDHSLLYFIVPVAVVVVFNIFVTIRVVVQIVKMSDGPTMQGDMKKRAKYGVKAMMVLLPIMGLTWVVGFLAVDRAKVVFLYVFIVLNCLQGVFIFFVHFFRNSEVRKACQRKIDKWAVSQSLNGELSSSKNARKSSSSGAEKNLGTMLSPMPTMTMTNL